MSQCQYVQYGVLVYLLLKCISGVKSLLLLLLLLFLVFLDPRHVIKDVSEIWMNGWGAGEGD